MAFLVSQRNLLLSHFNYTRERLPREGRLLGAEKQFRCPPSPSTDTWRGPAQLLTFGGANNFRYFFSKHDTVCSALSTGRRGRVSTQTQRPR